MSGLITLIHIGKTGGTAVHKPLKKYMRRHPDFECAMPSHRVGLEQVVAETPHSRIIFFIREPVSRFISGFNSRLRAGWPRYSGKWLPEEEEAFSRFKTPNAIAEALSSDDRALRKAAIHGMRSIRHTKLSYQHYLGSVTLLNRVKDKIIFIGEQENLDDDFEVMKAVLGLPARLSLPDDDIAAHRTPEGYETTISDLGRKNILDYYADELDIYHWCKQHRQTLLERHRANL
jgi:hypothetical protein